MSIWSQMRIEACENAGRRREELSGVPPHVVGERRFLPVTLPYPRHVTPWFYMDDASPVRAGWYEVSSNGENGARWYWDGVWFHQPWSEHPGRWWRGLNAPPPPEEYWVQRDGTRIKVGDMTEEHVKAVLRMLIRHRRRQALLYLEKHYPPGRER